VQHEKLKRRAPGAHSFERVSGDVAEMQDQLNITLLLRNVLL
jgi:hypothetical protein